jgi:hypothetical protein
MGCVRGCEHHLGSQVDAACEASEPLRHLGCMLHAQLVTASFVCLKSAWPLCSANDPGKPVSVQALLTLPAMDVDERSASGNAFSLEMQPAASKLVHPKDALAELNDVPVSVRSYDGDEETFLALKQLEAEREVQVSGCFQKYVSFRPYIVAWIYDTCLR